jgi:cell division protease FtsH
VTTVVPRGDCGLRRVHLKQAKEQAPCIIFLDEMDALGKARGLNSIDEHDERECALNQLLVEPDWFQSEGRGHHPCSYQSSEHTRSRAAALGLLRPPCVAIDKPDIRGREPILKVLAKDSNWVRMWI